MQGLSLACDAIEAELCTIKYHTDSVEDFEVVMCGARTEKFLIVLLLFKSLHSTLYMVISNGLKWTNYLDLVNTAIHPCESNPLPGLCATLTCSELCSGFMTHVTLHHHATHWSGPSSGALPMCKKKKKCPFKGGTVGNSLHFQKFALTEMTSEAVLTIVIPCHIPLRHENRSIY